MRNAVHAYVNRKHGNYQNGKKVGQKMADALMKYINKRPRGGKETQFGKGLTNGATNSIVYYLPGIVVRGTLKKIRGNTINANHRPSSAPIRQGTPRSSV
jgi:hypothetical protein